MPVDKVAATDSLQAGLAKAAPPVHPCPSCGKETVVHSVPGTRICTHPDCRTVVDVSQV